MKRISLFILSIMFAVAALAFPPFCVVYADEAGELNVHFIDVGQGDACIIELPDEKKILIDAGENNKEVESKLDSYIAANFRDDDDVLFDYAIMTHSDSDHIGSMDYVLSKYTSGVVYRPNQECTAKNYTDPATEKDGKNGFWGDSHGEKSTVTYKNALVAAYENAREVVVTNPFDDTQNVIKGEGNDAYELNFYSPISADYSDNNNYSPIMVLEYQGRKIVMTGDAEKKNEAEFVQAVKNGGARYSAFNDFSADVIKLGHHGSRTSSSEDYLNVVTKPSLRSGIFVVISCGEGNEYGHPHPEVLERLSSLGFNDDNILRTDQKGDIVITIKEEGGQYVVKYGDKASQTPSEGTTPNEPPTPFDWFASQKQWVKIVIIAVVLIIVVTVLIIVLRSGGKSRKKKSRSNKRR